MYTIWIKMEDGSKEWFGTMKPSPLWTATYIAAIDMFGSENVSYTFEQVA